VKLVIQIPAYDEERTLPATLDALPRALPGIERITVVVVDDGSRDETARIAAERGARVVQLPVNRGLANAFRVGLDAALREGADIVVNTDADNQYPATDIAALVAPILEGRADVVVGCRPIDRIDHFSPVKKILQSLGSWVVRVASGADVRDATSGFRAFTRDAAMQTNVFSRYTYTLETLIQAGQRGLRVVSVPVSVNAPTRESRLIRSTAGYVWRSATTIVRMLVVYRPFRAFIVPAAMLAAAGIALGIRFAYYYAVTEGPTGRIQSLVVAATLLGLAGILGVVAFVGDLLAINRRLLEDVQLGQRRLWYGRGSAVSGAARVDDGAGAAQLDN
jgi:glycosyltransferase involved in cell wall biosynthesis